MQQPQWINNKELLVKVAENFKLLEEQNSVLKKQLEITVSEKTRKSSLHQSQEKYNYDQLKILKLYSYKTWKQFMAWIDEKLEESGQTVDNEEQPEAQKKEEAQIKRVLSQILQQPDFQESYTLDRGEQKKSNEDQQNEAQLLAIQNAKLRRQNILLKSKLTEIKSLYLRSDRNEYFFA